MAKSGKGVVIDFTGVESGGAKVPADDYAFKVAKCVMGESKSSGNPMVVFTFEITQGKYKGKKLIERATLTKESLWKLKNILEALGIEVSGRSRINPESYVGEECGGTVADDEYNNKTVSRIVDFFPLEDLNGDDEDDDEDEEDEPTSKKSKKKPKKSKKSDDDDLDEIDLDNI